MIFDDMKTMLQRYGFDLNDPLDIWINAALQEVAVETNWSFHETVVGLTITAYDGVNSPFSDIPLDTRLIHNVYDHTNNEYLEYFSEAEFNRALNLQGLPRNYTLVNFNPKRIFVWPFNTAQVDIEFSYYREVPDLTAPTDIPDLPASMHALVVYRAGVIALGAESEEPRAKSLRTEYNDGLSRAYRAYPVTPTDSSQLTFQDHMDYGIC